MFMKLTPQRGIEFGIKTRNERDAGEERGRGTEAGAREPPLLLSPGRRGAGRRGAGRRGAQAPRAVRAGPGNEQGNIIHNRTLGYVPNKR